MYLHHRGNARIQEALVQSQPPNNKSTKFTDEQSLTKQLEFTLAITKLVSHFQTESFKAASSH